MEEALDLSSDITDDDDDDDMFLPRLGAIINLLYCRDKYQICGLTEFAYIHTFVLLCIYRPTPDGGP